MNLLGRHFTRQRKRSPGYVQAVVDRAHEELKHLSASVSGYVPLFRSEELALDLAYRLAGPPSSLRELFGRLDVVALRLAYPRQANNLSRIAVDNVLLRLQHALSVEESLVEDDKEIVSRFKDFLDEVSPGDF